MSSSSGPHDNAPLTRTQIEGLLRAEGFNNWGLARLEKPFSFALYEAWIEKGFHGEMDYLAAHLPNKRDPAHVMTRAKSAIVVTLPYLPHPEPVADGPLVGGVQVAAYARGRDYHHFLTGRLNRVIAKLQSLAPGEEFRCFTDSGPVMERDLAARAGLGWIGKNTCLLSRGAGSLFLIAEIFTSIEFAVATVEITDHCGTCTRCLEACPTGALVAPRELDARKCISYLTIESRDVPPLPLRAQMGQWLFGCDICQTVCPWNVKFHARDELADPRARDRAALVQDLVTILSSSNRALERAFHGTPLARPGGWGLKRNALIVAGNAQVHEVTSLVEDLLMNEKLGDLAAWALKAIRAPSAPGPGPGPGSEQRSVATRDSE